MLRLSLICATVALALGEVLPPSCEKPIYCNSNLLHDVQINRLFQDSKEFVDLYLLQDPDNILDEYNTLRSSSSGSLSRDQIRAFVDQHFSNASVLEDWMPPDFDSYPKFAAGIHDPTLRQFGEDVYNIWPQLGRRVKEDVSLHPDRYSLIPLDHGFIIPGGRFKEIYYWDTYWIIEGLLISGMKSTARGMIENLIQLLKKFGHIPNGSRWYYQERSQPPLLTAMVSLYFKETKEVDFLRQNIKHLENELMYWLNTQVIEVEKSGSSYSLLRYYAPSAGPRPESYYEDYSNAQKSFQTEDEKTKFYINIKSAAESGWDFSSRWFSGRQNEKTGDLSTINTQQIIPVDLNSIFAKAAQQVAFFQAVLKKQRQASRWGQLAKSWKNNIEKVLWDEESSMWYDYDLDNNELRKYFYPSNVAPLWMGVVDKILVRERATKILSTLKASGAFDYPGGIPTSLINNGEQWDLPNAWPPLVSIMVNALEALDTVEAKKTAFNVAQTWVRACHTGFEENGQMFEKYDVYVPGKIGGGGEYIPQSGFGWSNGVVLEFLAKYGRTMTAYDSIEAESTEKLEDASLSASSSDKDSESVEIPPL